MNCKMIFISNYFHISMYFNLLQYLNKSQVKIYELLNKRTWQKFNLLAGNCW